MPTFTNTTFASFYKRILQFGNSGNDGVKVVSVRVQDGGGVNTAIRLSDDQLAVLPNNDDMTSTFKVLTVAGNNILAVDTTNSKVLVGASQVAANTQYAHFGIDYAASVLFSADTHYAIPFTI